MTGLTIAEAAALQESGLESLTAAERADLEQALDGLRRKVPKGFSRMVAASARTPHARLLVRYHETHARLAELDARLRP